MNKFSKVALVAGALTAAAASPSTYAAEPQPNLIGTVCGVPNWHHITGAIEIFKVTPTTQLPNGLTVDTKYAIPLGAPFPPATTVGPNAYGRIVSAADINDRQTAGLLLNALGATAAQIAVVMGCFDVYDLIFDLKEFSDDGPGYFVVDQDAPVD